MAACAAVPNAAPGSDRAGSDVIRRLSQPRLFGAVRDGVVTAVDDAAGP